MWWRLWTYLAGAFFLAAVIVAVCGVKVNEPIGVTHISATPASREIAMSGFRVHYDGVDFGETIVSFQRASDYQKDVDPSRHWYPVGFDPEIEQAPPKDMLAKIGIWVQRFGSPASATTAPVYTNRSISGWVVRLPLSIFAVPLILTQFRLFLRGCRMITRKRWRTTGRCSQCGYDLRGGASTCPECGTAASM